jgi:biotin carboxyl carrier protein
MHAYSGEDLSVPERVIIAPSVGVFRSASVNEGTLVREGDEIGVMEALGATHAVRSPFAGTVMGVLAFEGERLRAGQPVAWLRAG